MKTDTSSLVILDVNNLLFAGLGVGNHLMWRDKDTAGIYGFVEQFCSIVNKLKPSAIVACEDSPPYERKTIFAEYKALRAAAKDKQDSERRQLVIDSRAYTKAFLTYLGVPLWAEKGLEADDMIANGCLKYRGDFSKIIIVSNDDDLFQLLVDDSIFLYMSQQKGKKKLYGRYNFMHAFSPMVPEDWVKYLALKGTHNNLKGVKGLGSVKARKIVNDADLWRETYKHNKETIDLHTQLISLPYRRVDEIVVSRKECNVRQTMGYLYNDFGIKTEPYMKEAWDWLCRG